MNARLRKLFTVLAGFVLCLVLFAPSSLAAEDPSVQLPVIITAEGTLPSAPENYVVRLTAENSAYPMPNGQVGGSFDLTIQGVTAGVIPPITYRGVGVYTYTIRQIPGAYPDCKYDTAVYTMRVTVTNAAGGGYDVTVGIHRDQLETKPDNVTFHNVYKVIVKPTTPPGKITPTGDSNAALLYLAGSALLLLVACGMICGIVRRERA